MYRLDMYHTIKTLLGQGYSQRKIARELCLHRKTVKRIIDRLESGEGPGHYARNLKLSDFEDTIRAWSGKLSGVLIHQRLVEEHGLEVSYTTVSRYLRRLAESSQESFAPLVCGPGEEAQVDFGDAGRFKLEDGGSCRVWVFVITLSHSRYSYEEVVRDQRVATFIRCHRNAFEYFGGVPARVKLDNLKAGVIAPSFYEPVLQQQYAEFLAHYGCAATPCRVGKPEHKGKVESGVKYVKNNFFRGLRQQDRSWEGLQQKLSLWTEKTNSRKHGTTRKIVCEAFETSEKPALLPLPLKRYDLIRWEQRKVNRYGHISFDCSYYSVPHNLVGQHVIAQSNGSILRILANNQEVALHKVASKPGTYLTRQEHLPVYKQQQGIEHFREKLAQIGPQTLALLEALFTHDPTHWKEKARGIYSLRKQHEHAIIDKACSLALDYQLYSYRSVKDICARLAHPPDTEAHHEIATSQQGFHHDLATYDQL
ncbi:MAG: IS21 family transposase [Bacteroidota bacterium]